MFYYLLYNSSLIKKKDSKEKTLYTLIGGSLIYIIIHAILSMTLKSEMVRYFWFIIIIDAIAMYIDTDFKGFSTLQINNTVLTNSEDKNKTIRDQIVDNYIDKQSNHIKPKKKSTPKPNLKKESKKKETNKSVKKKNVSFQDTSTPISILKRSEKDESYNELEANTINMTLENLESLDLDETKEEEENNFLRKKMEDEYSDPGSDLDLDQFEKSITGE